MGAGGALPQSNAIRALRGNPGKRQTAPTVKAEPIAPEPVHDLTLVARAEWDRMVPLLEDLGVLGQVDRTVLTQYCETWAINRGLSQLVRDDIDASRQTVGNQKSIWGMYQETIKTLTTLSKELLATPMSRARTPLKDGDDEPQGDILD